MSTLTNASHVNTTTLEEFILVGFSFPSNLMAIFFSIFLVCYLLTVAGNVLIITLYLSCPALHMPMYFFLCNLAILDITSIHIITPLLLRGLIGQTNKISITGCLAQCYFYYLVGTAQIFLIDVMCYDRYLAICHPLHYSALMCKRMCVWLLVGVLSSSYFMNLLPSALIMRLSFCLHKINHYFCDVGPLLQNSCSDSSFLQPLLLLNSGLLLFSLMVAAISYTHIILAISKINSADGRKKVFSTCSSHAMVVTLFFGSCIFMYIKPVEYQAVGDYDKNVAVLNTMMVPLINPYIYTLRNKTVKDILKGNKR